MDFYIIFIYWEMFAVFKRLEKVVVPSIARTLRRFLKEIG